MRLLLLALLLASTLAIAADSGGRRTAELMRLSGLHAQLGRLQADVVEHNEQTATHRPEDRARMGEIMKAAFAPEKMRDGFEREMRQLISADVENAAIAWFSSDFGRRVRAMEARVEAEGNVLRHPTLAKSYLTTSRPERRELYARLGSALRYADANADLLFNMFAAVTYAASIATGKQQEHHFIRARAMLAQRRQEIVSTLREQAMSALAYTYRDLTDEELTRYVEFAESPAGLRFSDACMRALMNVMTTTSTEVGTRIGEEFSRPRTKR